MKPCTSFCHRINNVWTEAYRRQLLTGLPLWAERVAAHHHPLQLDLEEKSHVSLSVAGGEAEGDADGNINAGADSSTITLVAADNDLDTNDPVDVYSSTFKVKRKLFIQNRMCSFNV